MVELPVILPPIDTARLHLRMLTPDDVTDIFDYASSPDVAKFMNWDAHTTIEDSQRFLDRILQSDRINEPYVWGIELTALRKIIGTVGFHNWRRIRETTEIGYVIGKPHWNKGYMTEAVGGVLDYFFRDLKMHRVEAVCDIANFASERVMQKLGMKLEGVMRSSLLMKDTYNDGKLYAILRDEWVK